MGRKPSASKIIVPMAENPSLDRLEPQPSNANITSPRVVDSKLENSNPWGSPLMYSHPFMDGAMTHNERTPAQPVNQENGLQKKFAKHTRNKSKHFDASIRRSERIKSAVVQTSNPNRAGIEYIVDGSESEQDEPIRDEPVTQMEQVLSEPEPELEPEPAENLNEKISNEKLEHFLQRIEALENITTLLKSKVDEINGAHTVPPTASINYESLYIESQKKIEALTAKLENALGKVEVYEKEHRAFIEVLDKMKDAVNASSVSNLAKATEAAVNASTRAMQTARSASAAKRKRNAENS